MAVLFVVLLTVSTARADDWPRWRGPNGDGINRESGLAQRWPATLQPLWRAEVGIGHSSPVAKDGRVYCFSLTGEQETLTCYEAASGNVVWSKSYEGGFKARRAGTRATPHIEGDRIYTYGGLGDLIARDLASGEQIWHLNVLRASDTEPPRWGTASNPLFVGDTIYVQGGIGGPEVKDALVRISDTPRLGRAAVAIDKKTGKITWLSESQDSGSYSHPILADVDGTKQLIVFAYPGPIGIDPATGKTIWKQRWKSKSDANVTDPVYRDGHLFITVAYDYGSIMLKLSPTGAVPEWTTKTITGRFQPPLLDGDHLYVNSEGTLQCIRWPTTEVLWETDKDDKNLLGIGGTIQRIAGDRMILLSQTGRLTLAKVTPAGFEEISSVPNFVEGRDVWASPTIHNGKLYVKGERELVCVDISAKAIGEGDK